MADRSARRRKQWTAVPAFNNGFTSNATAVGGGLGFTDADTVLRIIGEIGGFSSAAPVALDSCILTWAIGVFSTDAFAVGSTAMPDLASEPEYPWLYWYQAQFRFSTTALEAAEGSAAFRLGIDVRSMRKMKPRETLGFIYQYQDTGGSPPVTAYNTQCRVLLAKP